MSDCKMKDYTVNEVIKAIMIWGIALRVIIVLTPIWLPILITYKVLYYTWLCAYEVWTEILGLNMFSLKVIIICGVIAYGIMKLL